MNPFTGSRTPLTLSPHGIQDSLVFWIPYRGFRIPGTAVRIPIRPYMYSGIQSPGISDSTANISWIPESVHKRKFPRVRNPDSPTWREYFPWAAGRVISLQTSLIVNRSPLSVKRIPGFVFAFKTNARHSILCLDYIKVVANLAEAGDRLHNCCFCSGKVMLHGTIRNDDF